MQNTQFTSSFLRRSLLLLCSAAALQSQSFAETAKPDFIQPRNGLSNSFGKFEESQKTQAYTKISYFGGSITEGAGASNPEKCWRSLLQKHLISLHPGATLAENNSAIGGTGSWLGAYRTKLNALYGGAALVIVEFAVNDLGATEQDVLSSVEGIVRQIWQSSSSTDILFVYTMDKAGYEKYAKVEVPPTVQWYERIAAQYGIPSVNMGAYAAGKIKAGELTFDEFAPDGVHPSDAGYALYFDSIKAYVAQCMADPKKGEKGTPHKLADAVSPTPMEKANCVPVEWATLEGDWKKGQKSPVSSFYSVLQSDTPGATLSFRFKGSQCGLFDSIGPDTGDIEVSVDGGDWKLIPNWDKHAKSYHRAHSVALARNLDPTAWHDVKVRIAEKIPGESTGRNLRIGWLLVDGEITDPLADLDPLARIDAIWDPIKVPLKMNLSPDRFQHLTETMKRLKDGTPLRVVLLGDSIMGDTSSSQFELLLKRQYPKAEITRILSNRGSTGCWYYKDENRVEDYVFKHKPDLLMIGGISNRDDTEAIRSVIHQVREKSQCEIMLMTPAFGSMPDSKIATWSFEIDAQKDPYRAKLRDLATEEKCAFIDMTGPWWQFIQDSGCHYGYFQRDVVHANQRGFQILGHIVERFFAANSL